MRDPARVEGEAKGAGERREFALDRADGDAFAAAVAPPVIEVRRVERLERGGAEGVDEQIEALQAARVPVIEKPVGATGGDEIGEGVRAAWSEGGDLAACGPVQSRSVGSGGDGSRGGRPVETRVTDWHGGGSIAAARREARSAMQHWYVVHSKPRQETLAVEHLELQGFEVWLPRACLTRRIRGQWVERVEPLFPRYLFLHADVDRTDISPVRSTRGCSTIVRMAGQPAVVPDAVVEWLMASADGESGLHCIGPSVKTRLKAGEKVRVVEGPFEGAEGQLESVKGNERAVVLLKVLAESARVTVPLAQLATVQLG